MAVLGVVCAIFISVQAYQAWRVPRIGDPDVLRVGLLVFNRYETAHFQDDLAMQAGVWWPYYTPGYLSVLGLFYSVLHDYESVMLVIMILNYLVLLLGFYVLGRRLGLPFMVAVGLAVLSGFYIPSALGAPWNGLRLDMAAARNIYQALLPWILTVALELYRRFPDRAGYWLLFGFVVGLSVNLHPLTGPFLIGVLGLMMLAGWLGGRFRLQNIIAFSLGALPGLVLIYSSVYLLVADVSIQRAAEGIISGESGLFHDMAKANLIFYRLPNWWAAIGLYALASVVTAVGLLWARRSGRDSAVRGWWMAFGLAQFFGAMCLQVVDWLVLLAAVEWARRTREGGDSAVSSLTLLLLMGIVAQILCLGGITAMIGLNGIFPPAASIARAFIRGGHLPYAPLIIFAALAVRRWLDDPRWSQKPLLLTSVAATFALGFHLDARGFTLEGIPYSESLSRVGQIIPIDPWPYAGVVALLVWRWLDGAYRPLRYGWAAALVFQAATRLLSAPAGDLTTLAVGGIIAAAAYMQAQKRFPGRRLLPAALALVALMILLPIDGRPVVEGVRAETYRALQRNWSQTDILSPYYPLYQAGTWVAENTAPDALILSPDAYLRYWTRRSSFGGRADLNFLMRGSPAREMVSRAYAGMPVGESAPDAWVTFARQQGADYIIVSAPLDIPRTEAALVFQNSEYVVYQLVLE